MKENDLKVVSFIQITHPTESSGWLVTSYSTLSIFLFKLSSGFFGRTGGVLHVKLMVVDPKT